MKRTLIRRGLVVVCAGLVAGALTAAPAMASSSRGRSHHHRVVASGGWTDPGTTIVSVTPQGDKYLVDATGSTTTTGGFAGTSSYTMRLLWDPVSLASSGHVDETFTASLAGRGSGHLVLSEHIDTKGDGSTEVRGRIVGGDGVFRGADGFVRFVGHTDPSGSSPASGTYRVWIDLANHR